MDTFVVLNIQPIKGRISLKLDLKTIQHKYTIFGIKQSKPILLCVPIHMYVQKLFHNKSNTISEAHFNNILIVTNLQFGWGGSIVVVVVVLVVVDVVVVGTGENKHFGNCYLNVQSFNFFVSRQLNANHWKVLYVEKMLTQSMFLYM